MIDKLSLDAFFQEFAAPLVLRAGEETRRLGRGLMACGFHDPMKGPITPDTFKFLPLHVIQSAGYSPDVVQSVVEYDLDREVILLLNVGADKPPMLLKMELEREAPQGFTQN